MMKFSRSNHSASSVWMMALSIFLTMSVSGFLRGKIAFFLIPLVVLACWAPYIWAMSIQQKKASYQEKQELEAKFAAQDAELLNQAKKHYG